MAEPTQTTEQHPEAARSWSEEYASLAPRDRESLARVLNHLFTKTFLVKGKDDTRRDFYFLERHEALVRGYLEVAGWGLRLDPSFGVAQAVAPDASGRVSLDLNQSLALLILRLIYEEKRKQLSMTTDVVASVQEVQDKYQTLRLRNRPLDRRALKQAMGLFAGFELVEVLGSDATDPTTRLRLLPSILFAVRADTLASLHARLESYRRDGGNGGDEADSTGEDGDNDSGAASAAHDSPGEELA